MRQLLGKEKVCVWATDEEKYILFKDHADLGLPIEEGSILSSDGTPRLAMDRKETIDRIVPREVYGIMFRSVCIPVEGGTIGLSIDIEDTHQVLESIRSLSALSEEVAASAIAIASNSTTINSTVETVSTFSKKGTKRRKELEQVTKILYDITEHLQMLSLNAMIEAARAGESGKTFTVVAHEVKKLADNGKLQLKDIQDVISDVNRLLEMIDEEMSSIQKLTLEQSLSSDEIAASIRSVSSNIEGLQTLAEKL